jgi:hypothetical protein
MPSPKLAVAGTEVILPVGGLRMLLGLYPLMPSVTALHSVQRFRIMI